MEINLGTRISSFAEVSQHLLCLFDEDIAGVLTEGFDVKDVGGYLALELPLGSVRGDDA